VAFPQTRLRRLRRTPVLRDVVRETRLDAGDFVLPMFIEAGLEWRAPISAMPGVDRLSISQAVAEAGEAAALGLPGVLLFGIPADKDEEGSGAWDDEGIVQLATRAIKDAHPEVQIFTVGIANVNPLGLDEVATSPKNLYLATDASLVPTVLDQIYDKVAPF